MLAGVPVLVANSGGPLETVSDPETGWLRPVDEVEQWTEVMRQVLHELSEKQLHQMGENGRRRVREEFSETKMAHRLDQEFESMVKARRVEATELGDVALSIPVLGGCLLAICAVVAAAAMSEELHLFEISLGAAVVVVAAGGMVAVVYRLMQNESAFM